MTIARYQRLSAVLDRRQADLTIVADQVEKGRNLAAMVRSCDAVGIGEIHAIVPKDGYRSYNGTSASAQKWVKVRRSDSIINTLSRLKASNYQIVAANLYGEVRDYRDIDYTQPTAIVMGAEIEGVSDYAAEAADANVVLPMMGMVESLNVSVACALILNEAYRQREQKGMYDTRQLEDACYSATRFRWMYPRVARQLDRSNKPYPKLDDEGNILTSV